MENSLIRLIVVITLVLSFSSCKDRENLQSLKEAADRGNESYKQYKTGDYATAKAALLDYIRYLEERMRDPQFAHAETAKADIKTSYVRLAKLEEKNNGSEKETYMQRAISVCQQMQVKGKCSAEELRRQVDAVDAMVK